MSVINIKVGSRNYKISCSEGEENHILELSKKLDKKYAELAESLGENADTEMVFLILSLIQIDELENGRNLSSHENKNKKILKLSKKIDDIIIRLEMLK